MKANLNTGNNIILSVGMIVRNEAGNLAACLDAIQPLLKGVRSELVIVDTGSNDATVEIARRYTDKVYFFQWVNSFSAARNYGLDKCVGDWFMFLDADDVFAEGLEEMIAFFNNPKLSKKYNTGTYMTRNYNSGEKNDYSEFMQTRIFRREAGMRFTGRVHEAFGANPPVYNFKTYDYHTGYIFDEPGTEEAKSKRNMDLLKLDIEDNPTDLRNYDLAVRNTLDREEKAAFAKRAEELLHEAPADSKYLPMLYHCLITYHTSHDKDTARALGEEFLEKFAGWNDVIFAEIYASLVYLYQVIDEFDKAADAYFKYTEYLKRYENNELDVDSLRFINPVYLSKSARITVGELAIRCAMKAKNYSHDTAYDIWAGMDYLAQPVKRFRDMAENLRKIAMDAKRFTKLSGIYDAVLRQGDRDRVKIMEEMLEKLLFANIGSTVFEDDFTGNSGRFFALTEIMRLVNAESPAALLKLQIFLDGEANFSMHFSEAIYLAMKLGADLTSYIDRVNSELISWQLSRAAEFHKDFPELIVAYGDPENFTASVKQLYWLTSAYEKAVYVAEKLKKEKKTVLYDRFSYLIAVFVINIYNPALLNDNDVGALPALHRFGYRMSAAFGAKGEGDMVGYVRCLSAALAENKNMNDLISTLLANLETK